MLPYGSTSASGTGTSVLLDVPAADVEAVYVWAAFALDGPAPWTNAAFIRGTSYAVAVDDSGTFIYYPETAESGDFALMMVLSNATPPGHESPWPAPGTPTLPGWTLVRRDDCSAGSQFIYSSTVPTPFNYVGDSLDLSLYFGDYFDAQMVVFVGPAAVDAHAGYAATGTEESPATCEVPALTTGQSHAFVTHFWGAIGASGSGGTSLYPSESTLWEGTGYSTSATIMSGGWQDAEGTYPSETLTNYNPGPITDGGPGCVGYSFWGQSVSVYSTGTAWLPPLCVGTNTTYTGGETGWYLGIEADAPVVGVSMEYGSGATYDLLSYIPFDQSTTPPVDSYEAVGSTDGSEVLVQFWVALSADTTDPPTTTDGNIFATPSITASGYTLSLLAASDCPGDGATATVDGTADWVNVTYVVTPPPGYWVVGRIGT